LARFSTVISSGTGWETTKDPRKSPKVLKGSNPRSLRVLTMDPTERFLRLVAENRFAANGERVFMRRARNRSFTVTPHRLAAPRRVSNCFADNENTRTPIAGFQKSW